MDIGTGKTYRSECDALRDGVPQSDIANVIQRPGHVPQVRVKNGPFRGRVYVRNAAGQLVRVDRPRRGGL